MSIQLPRNAARLAIAVMLSVFTVLLLVSPTTMALASVNTPPVMLDTTQLQTGQTSFTDIYNHVSPSVVAISVTIEQSGATTAFGNSPDGTLYAGGSGFVIDKDGHIVTNNHVVADASSIEVNFFDGTLARATVVGLDPYSDLAVLKVDLPAEKLFPVEFANSDELQIGETVLAIGSPFGQRWTLTSGIISALERTISSETEFNISSVIQTDAAINPGNSGGPLLNLEGQVIGVNSQIISNSRASAGVGFAIPSNLTQRVAQDLIDNGFVSYSHLGIRGGNMNLDIIEALGLPNDMQGIVVAEALPGKPAARAGIQSMVEPTTEGGKPSVDIITAINGEPLTGIDDLLAYLDKNTKPGDKITLTVLRNGEETLDVEAQLIPRS